ncbi:MAG TPA: type II secretion system F family protein, partial [Nitrolancea sp.]|nr:type II secretion system F family protein [Nitrolancea sp.]
MLLFGFAILAATGLFSTCAALTTNSAVGAGQRPPAWPGQWERFLTRAGVRSVVSPGAFVAISLGAAALSGALTLLALHWVLPAVVVGGAGAALPALYLEHRQARRQREVQAALVDAISQLRASLASGQSVQQGLTALARTGPRVLRPECADLARDLQRYGVTPALRRLQARLADPLVDTFASALIMNDRSGGRQIGRVLEQLARAARAELLMAEESRAQQASTVLQARIIAVMPWALL